MYDFTTQYPRNKMGSEKWDAAQEQGALPSTYPLTVADMEFRTAPEIIESVQEAAAFGLWGYTIADDGFKKSVQKWMKKRHGWDAPVDALVAAPGVVPALACAVRAFTREGEGVLVQPPVYPPLFLYPQWNGRKIIENPLKKVGNAYEMDFADLEQKAKQAKMMILCSPHNPVGRVWTQEELARVAAICKKEGVILFVDEIHHDIIMPGHKHTCFATLPGLEGLPLVLATAASKTFSLAGLSCSSIFLLQAEMKKRYLAQMQKDGCAFTSTFGRVATQAGYEKGEPWLEEMIQVVWGNYQWLCAYCEEQGLPMQPAEMQATYLAWLDCRAYAKNKPDGWLAELQEKAQFYVNDGAGYGRGGEGYIRINLAAPLQVLQETMERVGKMMK